MSKDEWRRPRRHRPNKRREDFEEEVLNPRSEKDTFVKYKKGIYQYDPDDLDEYDEDR